MKLSWHITYNILNRYRTHQYTVTILYRTHHNSTNMISLYDNLLVKAGVWNKRHNEAHCHVFFSIALTFPTPIAYIKEIKRVVLAKGALLSIITNVGTNLHLFFPPKTARLPLRKLSLLDNRWRLSIFTFARYCFTSLLFYWPYAMKHA